MDANAAIVASKITKSFGRNTVLDGIDLHVPSGTVFALLGPNGAGKTTMVNILSTLLRPDSGRAAVAGHDVVREPDKVRAAISLTGQYAAVDELLTGEENMRMMGRLRHLSRADAKRRSAELLERFDLMDARKRAVKTYSGGMRRRLDLAISLIVRPPVIFLDEPTAGLDPQSRQTMWGTIKDLVASGVTILLTTQYLEEADQLAHRVAVLHGGGIIAEGTPEELKRRVPGGRIELTLATEGDFARALAVWEGELAASSHHDLTVGLASDGSVADVRHALDRAERADLQVATLALQRPTLDDVFLELTGHTTTSGRGTS